MAAPDLASEAADRLEPAYPGTIEAALVAAILTPFQRMADVILDDDGPFAAVFARTISDPAPLAWGAQWAGVDAGATEEQLRDEDFLRSRWRRGTVPAIRAAVASVLTGTADVRLYERRDPADFSADEPFHLTIVTNTDETPGGADSILSALRGILPSHLALHLAIVDGITWADLLDSSRAWSDVLTDFVDWIHVADGDPI